jgi:hypothetical protein
LRKPPIPEPAGIPEQRGDYLRLMGELIVLAFQNDLTRVASLIVDPERWDSPRMFHGVFDKPQNHHVLTHTKGDAAKAALTKIDRFHVELFAHVVERLRSIREGDGTLLDSCCVVMGSGLSDGDRVLNLSAPRGGAGGRSRPVRIIISSEVRSQISGSRRAVGRRETRTLRRQHRRVNQLRA